MSDLAVTGLRGLMDDVTALGEDLSDRTQCLPWLDGERRLRPYGVAPAHFRRDGERAAATLRRPEAENEETVAARRVGRPGSALGEYREYADREIATLEGLQATGVREATQDFGALAVIRLHTLADLLTFDAYLHLHEDVLAPMGPLERPRPLADETRLGPAATWITQGMALQDNAVAIGKKLTAPIVLALNGSGGGTWTLVLAGTSGGVRLEDGEDPDRAAATVRCSTAMIASWTTKRRDWQRCGVSITGDEVLATAVLDAVHII